MFLGYVLAACSSSLKATKVAEAGSGAISSRDREGMSSLGETCHWRQDLSISGTHDKVQKCCIK
jgi:hypothetical protein